MYCVKLKRFRTIVLKYNFTFRNYVVLSYKININLYFIFIYLFEIKQLWFYLWRVKLLHRRKFQSINRWIEIILNGTFSSKGGKQRFKYHLRVNIYYARSKTILLYLILVMLPYVILSNALNVYSNNRNDKYNL